MKTRVLYLMLICVVAATVYSLKESPNTQENLRQNNDTKTSTGKNNSEKFLVLCFFDTSRRLTESFSLLMVC